LGGYPLYQPGRLLPATAVPSFAVVLKGWAKRRARGIEVQASGIEELFGVLDADQSGAIDYREFAQLLIMNDQSPVPVPDRAVIKTKAARLRDAQLMQKQASV
jgi:hypothetical protein